MVKTKEFFTTKLTTKPDLGSYNAMLYAYSRNGNVHDVQMLLNFLEKEKENNNNNFQPDVISYNCLLNAHAKSKKDTAGEQAHEILNQMTDLASSGRSNIQPTSSSYTSVLQA